MQALHLLKHLEIYNANYLAFDPCYQRVTSDQNIQSKVQMIKDLYVDAGEEITPNPPKPRGKLVQVNVFVNYDHAGDRETWRSQTGIILYCNLALIIWYSKNQDKFESSTFGAECLALRIATDLIVSLRYKLRIIWVPIEGAVNVFCDNEYVYMNASFAES